ncbi:MAG: hypothetical protein ABL958_04015, partial [Bdellovibrionia bacterium]
MSNLAARFRDRRENYRQLYKVIALTPASRFTYKCDSKFFPELTQMKFLSLVLVSFSQIAVAQVQPAGT